MIHSAKTSPTISKKSAMKETPDRDSRQESQARRMVSFAESEDEMETVVVRTIPALSDFSKQEKNNLWYTNADFQIMKLGVVQLLRKVINGTYETSGVENEARGLENKTPEGSAARRKNRFNSLFAVLDEQERQRQKGQTSDPDYIARLYRQSSQHCQMQAIQVAANDFSVVHGEEAPTICDENALQKILQPPASPSGRSTMGRSIAASPIKSRSRRRLLSMMICK